MAQFQFRLDSLLDVRRHEHKRRQALLAEALAAKRLIEAQRDAIQGEFRREQRRMRARAAPGRLDVASLAHAHRYEASLRAQLAALAEQAVAHDDEINGRRQAVLEADRDVRALEKLRERQHERFLWAQARQQAGELDEFATRDVHGEPIT